MTRKPVLDRGRPAVYGRHGSRVRVYRETGGARPERIVVQWREGPKRAKALKKKIFDATKAGEKEAISYARGKLTLLEAPPTPVRRTPITLHEMYELFADAEFPHLRPSTQRNYRDRWRAWERTWGPHFEAESTTIGMVDQFLKQERKLGHSANQTRNILTVVRVVYNWATLREHLVRNRIALYRWRRGKDDQAIDPGEYATTDRDGMLGRLDPSKATDWRAHATMLLMGHHGIRVNACRHLRWEDVTPDEIIWPAKYQKNGEDFRQPMTWEAWAAIETARSWAARDGYTGPWVFYAAGWATKDQPVSYQTLHYHLRRLEADASIAHQPYRAFHGLRRMVAGEVLDGTDNVKLAMEWIGDRDLKQMKSYLKRRDTRLQRAADVVSGRPESAPQTAPNALSTESTTDGRDAE